MEEEEGGGVAFTFPRSEALTPPLRGFEYTTLVEGNDSHGCSAMICMLNFHLARLEKDSATVKDECKRKKKIFFL